AARLTRASAAAAEGSDPWSTARAPVSDRRSVGDGPRPRDDPATMARPRLTSLDASFLRVETSSAHMHVGWKGLFAPQPGRPVTLTGLRASIAARLHHAQRFRQRLAFPPGGLAEPVWVDDEYFAIEQHVVALSGPEDRL